MVRINKIFPGYQYNTFLFDIHDIDDIDTIIDYVSELFGYTLNNDVITDYIRKNVDTISVGNYMFYGDWRQHNDQEPDPDDVGFGLMPKVSINTGRYLNDPNVKSGKIKINLTIYDVNTLDRLKEDLKTGVSNMYRSRSIIRESVLRFGDIENIEYRKGSKKFGGLLVKLMEFLRMYKDKEENNLSFNITDFEEKSNININDIKELMNDEKGKTLYKFDISIDDNTISFSNLTSDKNRFFEGVDIDNSIRKNYELYGVEDFYKNVGGNYINPHYEDIKMVMNEIHNNYNIGLNNVLDLASGKGEITTILKNFGYKNITGCDPYLYNEYHDNTDNKCLSFSFEDIQKGALDKYKFDTIICSYALHLAKPSIVPELLWRLSLISKNLIIISPNNKPFITEDYGWRLYNSFKMGRAKCRIYISKNKETS